MNLLVLLFVLWTQSTEKPLPDPGSFLAEFRKTLHRDRTLLSHYTYTETETHTTLDSKGNGKKTEVSIYQVLHESEGEAYRRLISKNGIPLSPQEIARHDREEEERVAKQNQKKAGQSEAKRLQEKEKEDREEQETLDDVFAMYDVRILRREVINGISTIAIAFDARPNYKPRTGDGKILQHIGGRVWIAEDDHELARLEAQVNDPISIGAGILAKLQKGSTLTFERSKINNEIWLPVRVDIAMNARLLLFKGMNFHQVNEYADHKKYSADTILKFGDIPIKPVPQ